MNTRSTRLESVDLLILRVAKAYADRKMCGRTGLDTQSARKERERVLRDAHTNIKIRYDRDFVDYFATLCWASDFTKEEFRTLTRALKERPHQVRITMMLALSAAG
ncbi:hypothetical protein LZC95_19450 [Pendulispora brunnea]|uniref:Type I-B CRISPR Cas8b C-terminal domain-containing protein n=1 Tax=Pendulispora brunnea TaxID=2905690 RepID=A0ABZ2KJY8_9BACT